MAKFSPNLKAAADAAPTKDGWGAAVNTYLGTNRKMVCKVGDIGTDIWATGTIFRSCDLTGPIDIRGGDIHGYGIARNATVQNAADLSTKAAVMRIISGSEWAEYTMGLVVDDTVDVAVSANPIANRGMGIVNFVHLAPQFRPSGQGPAAPLWDDANTPYTVVIDDWTTPTAVVESGRASFNDRQPDFNWNEPFLEERGDTAVYLSQQTITHRRHVFGIRLFAAPPIQGSDPSVGPLYQINICCAPAPSQGWTGYPAMANYNQATMSTLPAAFKVRLLNKAGVQVGGIEMVEPAGYPINDPRLAQTVEYNGKSFDTDPVHPHYNCAMQMVWENRMAQDSPMGRTIFNGVQSDAYRPSSSRAQASTNHYDFYFMRSRGPNSIGHPAAMQAWPMSRGPHPDDNPDPHIDWKHTGTWPFMLYAYGHRFQTGSRTGQDNYMGPGGSRWVRGGMPAQVANFVSDPNGVRLENLVPKRQMYWEFSKAYFNCSISFMRDVRTFQGIPEDEALAGDWQFASAYYSNGQVPDPTKFIDLRIPGNAGEPDASHFDASGRFLWAGYAPDYMHYWENPWPAIVSVSPMHAALDKQQLITMIMASLGDGKPTRNWKDMWCYRTHAVVWMKLAMSWFMAGKLSVSRAKLEQRLLAEIAAAHTQIVVPANNNANTIFTQSLKRLGMPGWLRGGNSTTEITSSSGNHQYFHGMVMYVWKVTGLWDRMRELSPVAGVQTLDFWAQCMWKATIDLYHDTDGWWFGSNEEWQWMNLNQPVANAGPASIFNNWAEWLVANPKPNVNVNVVRNTAGQTANNLAPQTHMLRQCMHVLRDFFPETGSAARADAACAKIDAAYAAAFALSDAQATPIARRNADFTYLFPGSGVILAPMEA